MFETAKCQPFRERRGDFTSYLRGNGIDIGSGSSPLQVPDGNVMPWDLKDGDAQKLASLKDGSFDFVYSSHCLEHMRDIGEALANWTRVLKDRGILYVVVPDFELYEKRRWPPRFNRDHKATFSLNIRRSRLWWRRSHFNLSVDILPILERHSVFPLELRLEDYGYDYSAPRHVDQTMGQATAQLCFIARKRSPS